MIRSFAFVALLITVHATAFGAAPTCPAGIGASSGDPPRRVFDLGEGALVLLCGWSDAKPGLGAYYSEFEVVDSRSGAVALRLGAVNKATLEQEGASLHFTEYREYPIGKGFEFIEVPYRLFTIQPSSGRLVASCQLVLKQPVFTPQQLLDINALYKEAQSSRPHSEAIGVLVVLAAMTGDKAFEALLPRVPEELRLDGHYAEEFQSAMRDLAEVRAGRCELGSVP